MLAARDSATVRSTMPVIGGAIAGGARDGSANPRDRRPCRSMPAASSKMPVPSITRSGARSGGDEITGGDALRFRELQHMQRGIGVAGGFEEIGGRARGPRRKEVRKPAQSTQRECKSSRPCANLRHLAEAARDALDGVVPRIFQCRRQSPSRGRVLKQPPCSFAIAASDVRPVLPAMWVRPVARATSMPR